MYFLWYHLSSPHVLCARNWPSGWPVGSSVENTKKVETPEEAAKDTIKKVVFYEELLKTESLAEAEKLIMDFIKDTNSPITISMDELFDKDGNPINRDNDKVLISIEKQLWIDLFLAKEDLYYGLLEAKDQTEAERFITEFLQKYPWSININISLFFNVDGSPRFDEHENPIWNNERRWSDKISLFIFKNDLGILSGTLADNMIKIRTEEMYTKVINAKNKEEARRIVKEFQTYGSSAELDKSSKNQIQLNADVLSYYIDDLFNPKKDKGIVKKEIMHALDIYDQHVGTYSNFYNETQDNSEDIPDNNEKFQELTHLKNVRYNTIFKNLTLELTETIEKGGNFDTIKAFINEKVPEEYHKRANKIIAVAEQINYIANAKEKFRNNIKKYKDIIILWLLNATSSDKDINEVFKSIFTEIDDLQKRAPEKLKELAKFNPKKMYGDAFKKLHDLLGKNGNPDAIRQEMKEYIADQKNKLQQRAWLQEKGELMWFYSGLFERINAFIHSGILEEKDAKDLIWKMIKEDEGSDSTPNPSADARIIGTEFSTVLKGAMLPTGIPTYDAAKAIHNTAFSVANNSISHYLSNESYQVLEKSMEGSWGFGLDENRNIQYFTSADIAKEIKNENEKLSSGATMAIRWFFALQWGDYGSAMSKIFPSNEHKIIFAQYYNKRKEDRKELIPEEHDTNFVKYLKENRLITNQSDENIKMQNLEDPDFDVNEFFDGIDGLREIEKGEIPVKNGAPDVLGIMHMVLPPNPSLEQCRKVKDVVTDILNESLKKIKEELPSLKQDVIAEYQKFSEWKEDNNPELKTLLKILSINLPEKYSDDITLDTISNIYGDDIIAIEKNLNRIIDDPSTEENKRELAIALNDFLKTTHDQRELTKQDRVIKALKSENIEQLNHTDAATDAVWAWNRVNIANRNIKGILEKEENKSLFQRYDIPTNYNNKNLKKIKEAVKKALNDVSNLTEKEKGVLKRLLGHINISDKAATVIVQATEELNRKWASNLVSRLGVLDNLDTEYINDIRKEIWLPAITATNTINTSDITPDIAAISVGESIPLSSIPALAGFEHASSSGRLIRDEDNTFSYTTTDERNKEYTLDDIPLDQLESSINDIDTLAQLKVPQLVPHTDKIRQLINRNSQLQSIGGSSEYDQSSLQMIRAIHMLLWHENNPEQSTAEQIRSLTRDTSSRDIYRGLQKRGIFDETGRFVYDTSREIILQQETNSTIATVQAMLTPEQIRQLHRVPPSQQQKALDIIANGSEAYKRYMDSSLKLNKLLEGLPPSA